MTFRRTTCPHCRQKLEPGQRIHPACIPGWADAQAAKAERAAEKERRMAAKFERADVRRRKAAVKTTGDLIREAQTAFNGFIRLRDRLAGHPCISSGRPLDWSGNNVDAGHYRSRGSAPHLRFDERNCHAQSKQENRYASGNATDYRIGLIARIGRAAVEALESDNTPRRYTHDELRAIRALYLQKTKELKKEREL